MPNEIGRQCRKPVVLIVREAVFDRHGLALDIASFFQAAAKSVHELGVVTGAPATEETDHRHRWLLGARSERPGECRAADYGYQLPSCDADCHLPRLLWGHAR